MVGGGAQDAHAVHREKGQPPCRGHDGQGQQSAGDGETEGGDAAPEEGTQQTAHAEDGQRHPPAQKVEGEEGDQVGQPQLDAGQRHQQLAAG